MLLEQEKELLKKAAAYWPKVKSFLSFYPNGYEIYLLSRGKGRIKVATHMDRSTFMSLFVKHLHRKEEVILVPKDYTAFYIEDPKIEVLAKNFPKSNYIAVLTSPLKIQLHILVPKKLIIAPEFYKAYQKACQTIFQSESVAWNHGRKVPGFLNWKYPDSPYMIEVLDLYTYGMGREYYDLIQEIHEKAMAIASQTEISIKNLEKAKEELAKLNIQKTTILKAWTDFYQGDESVADIKYAIYLLSRGLSVEETIERLLAESPDIRNRKKGHLEDYITRTITKAVQRVIQFYQHPIQKNTPNQDENPFEYMAPGL